MIDRHVARRAEEIRAHAPVHVPPRALRPDPQKHIAHELLGDGAGAHEAVRVAAEHFIVRAKQRPERGRAAAANGRDDLAILISAGPLVANRFDGWRHHRSPAWRPWATETVARSTDPSRDALRHNRTRHTVYDDV